MQPVGKNNGTVQGHKYFECPPKCGVLVAPSKVSLIAEASEVSAAVGAKNDAAPAAAKNAAPVTEGLVRVTVAKPLGISIMGTAEEGI